VLQGEREIAAHNKSLGKFELVGIPSAPKGVPQVEVAFDIDSNGIVNVSAKDLTTGKEQKILVTPSGGLSEEDIRRIVEDAREHADEDRRRAEFVRVRSRLEGIVESTSMTFGEFGGMLPPDGRARVKSILERAKKALEVGSLTEVLESLERVAEAGKILSEVILYDPGSFSVGKEDAEAGQGG